MRKLARAVGLTAPAVYRYYEGKEHVLADVVRLAHREFMAAIYRALEAPTPVERLAQAGEGYLDFALQNPRWYAIMFASPEHLGMESMPEDIEAMGQAIHQFWIDRVRECMEAGLLKQDDPCDVSLTMWSHAHGMVDLFHQGHFQIDQLAFRTMFEQSGVRLLRGLATDDLSAQLLVRTMHAGAGAET